MTHSPPHNNFLNKKILCAINKIHNRSKGVPRNLKRVGGRNFLFPFPLKISVKSKKRGLHIFRRLIYPPKSSEDHNKMKRSSRLSRLIYPPKSSEDQKKRSTRPQMSCFHCFTDCRHLSAYVSADGGVGATFGYAPEKANDFHDFISQSLPVVKTFSLRDLATLNRNNASRMTMKFQNNAANYAN